jgi:hypothetical protein
LEEEVVTASEIYRLTSTIPPEHPEVEACIESIDNIMQQLGRMESVGFSHGTFNTVVATTGRDEVASLDRIDKAQISSIKNSIVQSNVDLCVEILRQFTFTAACQQIAETPTEGKLRAADAVAARFLDFAIVSFCGAHMGPFDEVYLGGRKPELLFSRACL